MDSTAPGSPQPRSAECIYFDAGGHVLFGWLHQPSPACQADVGMVICKPFGYEAICAHRGTRAFAEAAVAAGIPALRFDYAGTGNSEDLPAGSEELSVWIRDVQAAAEELQRRTGVSRVVLLGIRLGAMLATLAATLAATRGECPAGLVLVAPVISGQRYLRELRMVQLAASDSSVVEPSHGTRDEPSDADAASFEVCGFALAGPTIDALRLIDLNDPSRAPARQILVLDRDDLPGAARWSEALSCLGADIEYFALAGIVQMVWTAPQFGAAPAQMITALGRWLDRLAAGSPRLPGKDALAEDSLAPMQSHTPVLQLEARGASGCGLLERPVYFAQQPRRFGIVTEPAEDSGHVRGVILVNDGATYHVGANRMNVSLARRWAAQGCIVLRMDLAGLGESDARPGRPVDEVFPPEAVDDIRAAIDYLRSEYGCEDVTLGGLCSGAYHALRCAVAGLPLERILLVNPQIYFWREGMRIDELQLVEIVRGPSRYREHLLSAKRWSKLLRGRADIRYILQVAAEHVWFRAGTVLRNCARRLHIRLAHDLGRELQQIVERGVRIVFVFARGEVGLELLRIQAGTGLAQLGERCRIHIIDDADHIFSQSKPRQTLENILSAELFDSHPFSGSGARGPHMGPMSATAALP